MNDLTNNVLQIEILKGLQAEQKSISPKFFYDKRGAELFEEITLLPEYYPTRTETSILIRHANEIADVIQQSSVIIEPGAGSCEKIRHLLPSLMAKAYIAQDVSAEILLRSAKDLEDRFPDIEIITRVGDFFKPIVVPEHLANEPKTVFYPGSTIGNFSSEEAVSFLKRMRKLVGSDGGLLLGADLHKDKTILEGAYNDARGVTAEFNLNMLNNINRILGSEIDTKKFTHSAFYNQELRRIEMHLISSSNQSYQLLGQSVRFAEGETIHTESSHKYTQEDLHSMAQLSGFTVTNTWMDESELFSVSFFAGS